MLTRRELLKLGVYTAASSYFPRTTFSAGSLSPKKILVLGGTGFLGPPLVERAIDRGHTVTLFNRGKTGTDLFPSVEKIHGDREKGDLSGLTNDRRWDAVVDVWANDPAIVAPIANLLAKRTSYYHFVSSISVYADYSKVGIDETGHTRLERPGYGGNKAKSEKALTDLLGDRVGICRPCAIMGPHDTSLSYHYWLSHLLKGPGDRRAWHWRRLLRAIHRCPRRRQLDYRLRRTIPRRHLQHGERATSVSRISGRKLQRYWRESKTCVDRF
jgi:2'-hydroxyisoflavone reductase